MHKPLIGVTAGEVVNHDRPWAPIVQGQMHTYIETIIKGGGIPIILPLTKDLETLNALCAKIDGLLMSGGNDINPQLYGESPHVNLEEPSALRDNNERHLFKNAQEIGLPILAICRGLQFINVYNGGNLYQDIKSDLPNALNHESSTQAHDLTHHAHNIHIDKTSKLYKILGTDIIMTNSHHHQSIKDIGEGLRVTARSEDGVIEAIESDDDRFIIGVQSHPETLTQTIPDWAKLFEAFIVAAKH